jgi:type IX secretion system PorP/SprF family membrane protein
MKKLVVISFFLICGIQSHAQQHSLYSQYIFNLYAINPAYAGERNSLATALSYRSQWVGIEGAPKTAYFSAHTPVRNKNLALGFWFQNEQIGARELTSLHGSVSYKLRLTKTKKISFALSAGALNHQYHWDELDFPDGADPVSFVSEANQWSPSFDFGAMYISPQGYAGLSILNLNGMDLSQTEVVDARLEPNINLVGGYVFPVSQAVDLKPGGLVRLQANGVWQFDASMSARFNDAFWITTTYRHQFGMVFSGHFYLNDHFHFGYSYDLTTNELLTQQGGSHELFIGYDFRLYKTRSSTLRNF